MNSIKDQVRLAILGDEQIVAKLSKNKSPYDKKAPAAKKNSVVDYLNVDQVSGVFLSIRSDVINKVGPTILTDAFLLVRCYNSKDKTFFTINEVLSRVQKLLDGQRFELEGYANIETVWETTGPELPDDALNSIFREATFRFQII